MREKRGVGGWVKNNNNKKNPILLPVGGLQLQIDTIVSSVFVWWRSKMSVYSSRTHTTHSTPTQLNVELQTMTVCQKKKGGQKKNGADKPKKNAQ